MNILVFGPCSPIYPEITLQLIIVYYSILWYNMETPGIPLDNPIIVPYIVPLFNPL